MFNAWVKANSSCPHEQVSTKPSRQTTSGMQEGQQGIPEMFCEVLGSIEVTVGAMAHAQLACEVAVMHVLPKLLPTKEVDVAEATEGVGCCHMGLQLLLTGKHWQLQRERTPSL